MNLFMGNSLRNSVGGPEMPATLGQGVPESVRDGDTRAVAAWLDGGGGVDADHIGVTLLMTAAIRGEEATVRLLLQRGASVNLQNCLGYNALMLAAFNGHTTIAQTLLDAKADASLQNKNGFTALIMAEQGKKPATAHLLRQHVERQAAEAATDTL